VDRATTRCWVTQQYLTREDDAFRGVRPEAISREPVGRYSKSSVGKKFLVVGLKRPGAKTK
jgi:hypothetical protein